MAAVLPTQAVPRNRVVSRTDPGIQQSAEIENIFTLTPTSSR